MSDATPQDLTVVGAIRPDPRSRTGMSVSHRYTSDAPPAGEIALWLLSDGTVRWKRPPADRQGAEQ